MMDDLFTMQTAILDAPRLVRVTCRACRLTAEVAIDAAARLCPACLADIPATVAHLRAQEAAAFWRVDEAWWAFDAALAHADEATQARWGAYMDAGDGPQVQETRRRVRAGLVAGPLADLIRAHVAWLDAHAQLVEMERWRHEALAELELVAPNAADLYREL